MVNPEKYKGMMLVDDYEDPEETYIRRETDRIVAENRERLAEKIRQGHQPRGVELVDYDRTSIELALRYLGDL